MDRLRRASPAVTMALASIVVVSIAGLAAVLWPGGGKQAPGAALPSPGARLGGASASPPLLAPSSSPGPTASPTVAPDATARPGPDGGPSTPPAGTAIVPGSVGRSSL